MLIDLKSQDLCYISYSKLFRKERAQADGSGYWTSIADSFAIAHWNWLPLLGWLVARTWQIAQARAARDYDVMTRWMAIGSRRHARQCIWLMSLYGIWHVQEVDIKDNTFLQASLNGMTQIG